MRCAAFLIAVMSGCASVVTVLSLTIPSVWRAMRAIAAYGALFIQRVANATYCMGRRAGATVERLCDWLAHAPVCA